MRKLRPLIALLVLVTGCSVAPVATTSKNGSGTSPAPNASAVKGAVYGGQQPIIGAQVYVLAVSTGGSGQPSTSLMNNVAGDTTKGVNGWYYVPTLQGGEFSIKAADYTCTTGQQVYLYTVGGNPQVAGTNVDAGLMAVLGKCTAPGTFTGMPAHLVMNEVTTVAAAYALAGFAKDATDISGPNSATAAIANAAAAAGNLVDLGTGLPRTTTPAGNGTVPSAEIISLADILGACVNSGVTSNPPPSGSNCDTLFKNATNNGQSGGTEPTETASAAINIAHYPGNNITALWNTLTPLGAGAAFTTGGLKAQPNDFSVAVTYTGGSMNEPYGIAVDGNGSIWATNEGGTNLTKLDWLGNASSISGSLSAPKGIAIDSNNNVWVANSGNNTVSEYNGSSFSNPSGGSPNAPTGVAIDASNDVWVTNGNNSVTEYVSGAGTNYTGGGLDNAKGVATDAFGNAWVADQAGARISEFNASGAISGSTGYTGASLNGATGIAIDPSSTVWVTNQTGNSLSTFTKSGTGGSNYTGGGLNGPSGIAIDGAGNLWVANYGSGSGNSISEYIPGTGFISTTSGGYRAESADGSSNPMKGPKNVAIDPSGNVWVTNNGNGANSVTEFVGIASPVASGPLVNHSFSLAIENTSLPTGTAGSPYSASLIAGGGTQPYTWSQTGGTSLSTWGLSLNASTGAITGTPTTTANNVALTFTVSDSSSPQQQQSVTLNLTINAVSGVTIQTITPRNAGITVHQTLSISATTSDGSNVMWSATAGTFSSSSSASGTAVTYTPSATAGAYVITASAALNPSSTLTSNVGVTDLASVWTYHNDNNRDGANTQEYALTPTSVATSTFGKLFSCTVDSPIYTQPLWVSNVTVGGQARNVVLVATTNDSLYAFDADGSSCTQLWKANLIDSTHGATANEVPVPTGPPTCVQGTTLPAYCAGAGGGDITPTTGVIGTPVVDPSTDTIYVVSKSVVESGPSFYQRLHAIKITDGTEALGNPVTLTGGTGTNQISFTGTGDDKTYVVFNPQTENQRCALALDAANHIVYVSWAGHEDAPPYYGWVVGFHTSDLSVAYTYNSNPNQALSAQNTTYGGAGIWMSGGAPAIDSSGNLYVLTGNGTVDVNKAPAANNEFDYGDSLLKLSPNADKTLHVADYFTPPYASNDNTSNDDDFGSGGTVVLVSLPGTPSTLMIGGGKAGPLNTSGATPTDVHGYFYVLNGSSLGGYNGTPWQQVYTGSAQPIYGTGAFLKSSASGTVGTYYISTSYAQLEAYSLSSSTEQLTLINSTPNGYEYPGPTPSISAAGTTDGIVWALDNSQYCTPESYGCSPAILYAYNAATLQELWDSTKGTGNAAGNAMKFVVPTVANGKVYVSTRGTGTANDTTTGELDVYGLLP